MGLVARAFRFRTASGPLSFGDAQVHPGVGALFHNFLLYVNGNTLQSMVNPMICQDIFFTLRYP